MTEENYRTARATFTTVINLFSAETDEKVRSEKEELRSYRLGFRGVRTLFVHEWDLLGREDCISAASRSSRPLPPRLYRPCRSPQSLHSRDVADHDACNAFNRLLGLVVYPRNDRRARRRLRRTFGRQPYSRGGSGTSTTKLSSSLLQ
jgi:hypothetical protein